MKTARSMLYLAVAGSGLILAACSDHSAPSAPASTTTASPATSAAAGGTTPAAASTGAARQASTSKIAVSATVAPTWSADAGTAKLAFTPPSEADIPDNDFGDMVRKGRDIFTHTRANAGEYAGNHLNCSNCHLDAGRRADSAPLWAAWGRYPRYRDKNDKVNTYADRLQGCFQFSMNGKAPPADSDIILALSAYSYWMAKGLPAGVDVKGFGFAKQGFEPPEEPDYARGEKVYADHCALCHGDDGQGQKVAGAKEYVFPPLWGPDSFNWGAGMHSIKTAAAFIKVNMPFSRGGTLSDQQAWDVAKYMDSHERPQDPRFTGDIAETRKKYHDSKWSPYGTEINGRMLGQGTSGEAK